MLLALTRAPTFKLLTSLVAPKQPGELKFKDICDILKKHYSPQPIKMVERYHFYNTKQLQGESLADYLAKLQKLASRCKFGAILEEALWDRLVCGIRDHSMQLRLLAEFDLSLKKALSSYKGWRQLLRMFKKYNKITSSGCKQLQLLTQDRNNIKENLQHMPGKLLAMHS